MNVKLIFVSVYRKIKTISIVSVFDKKECTPFKWYDRQDKRLSWII